ncbi:hypothetical protein [Sphingomonas sp. PAMC 26605]|uniref:hypothetical protein n=1 Tax=Sphingomonas sp. PAMC 26605 TaxID=1112214 RepID=UPI00026CC619|nr:hypothetical protein [Sphingomonas sp. PAMC 26605]
MTQLRKWLAPIALLAALNALSPVCANGYREKGKAVSIVNASLTVTPPRDWNRLSAKPGKKAETWTLDGEQLNDITWYVGIAPGEPLVREVSKKRKPLPKFTGQTLLVELPELVEATYRSVREIGTFSVTGSAPDAFLGQHGIRFTYAFIDQDNLPRQGEARAAVVKGLLYLVTFDAPRLNFFAKSLQDFRALSDAAKLS